MTAAPATTQTSETTGSSCFDHHPLPRDLWPAFAGKRPDAELAQQPDLPLAEQLRLAHHHLPKVRRNLAENPRIEESVQWILAGTDAVWLAGNPSLSPELQLALLERRDDRIIREVAASAQLGPTIRAALAGNPKYRAAVARNRLLPAEVYQKLSLIRDRAVRLALAGNPSVGPEILEQLAGDRNGDIRQRLAGNPSLPAPAQLRLALSPDPWVRQSLARNRSLAPEVQELLSRDRDAVGELAGNPSLATELIDWLLEAFHDPGETRPGLLGVEPFRYRLNPDARARMLLAMNRRLALRQQQALARDPDSTVRATLAWNPRLDTALQLELAEDASLYVRSGLAGNPSLVGDAQVRLAKSDSHFVLEGLLRNPALERTAVRLLLDARIAGTWTWQPELTPRVPALGVATHWTPASLDHPVLGPLVALFTGKRNVLAAAAEHPDPLVRWGLLGNDRIGTAALGLLVRDAEPAIAAAARRRFVLGLAG